MLLTVEKLVYGGDGLARLPGDEHGRGKAVFIPFVLDGEKVEASVTAQKAGFARANAEAVIEASPHRVQPACPYFGRCGGCQYQHIAYEHQLEVKKNILRETLLRTAKLELPDDIQTHPSPPWNYRNRSRLQVQFSPSFALGYFKHSSQELQPVEECPISSPLINRGIAALWRNGRAGKVPPGIRELEFFSNADDSQLLTELWCTADAHRQQLRAWAEELRESVPEIAGIVAFRETDVAGSTLLENKELIAVGVRHLIYRTQQSEYRVSAGSFFQTNRHLIDELLRAVTEGQAGELALDLYAGVGLFSTALAGDFHHIVSVEPSQTPASDLSYNRSSNTEAVQATTDQYLARGQKRGRAGKGIVVPHIRQRPDLAVVDPPRSGLGERVARSLANLGAPRVTYVSCDPATLARDLVILRGAGYRVEQAHLLDLFPQTYHLETVLHLTR